MGKNRERSSEKHARKLEYLAAPLNKRSSFDRFSIHKEPQKPKFQGLDKMLSISARGSTRYSGGG